MKRKKMIALLLTLALLLSAVPHAAAYGLDIPVGDAGYDQQVEPDTTDPADDPDVTDPAGGDPDAVDSDVADPDVADPAEDDPDGDDPDAADDPTGNAPDGAEPSYDDPEDMNVPDPADDGWDDPQDGDPAADAPEEDVPVTAVYNEPEAVEVFAASGSWQPKPNRTVTGSSAFPLKLSNGNVLQINGPVDFTAPTGQSAIQIDSGATVAIIINGSVTLHGADAKGTTGATAAINVPENAKLTIYSAHDEELSTSKNAPKDTLTVTGGNAAAGADGTMGEKKEIKQENIQQVTTAWIAGSGGNGGGGAAAAIGGNGGSGGSGCGGYANTTNNDHMIGGCSGGAECSKAEDKNDNKSQGGSGGSGGGVNGSGKSGSSGTNTGTQGHGYDNNRYDAEPGSGGAGGTEKDRDKKRMLRWRP